MSGTKRPLDSGRRDSQGRPVKVAESSGASRADAPPPPDSSDELDSDVWEPTSQELVDGSTRPNWQHTGDLFTATIRPHQTGIGPSGKLGDAPIEGYSASATQTGMPGYSWGRKGELICQVGPFPTRAEAAAEIERILNQSPLGPFTPPDPDDTDSLDQDESTGGQEPSWDISEFFNRPTSTGDNER